MKGAALAIETLSRSFGGVRELRPGLFLGQAYYKTKKREILMLYFGLEKPV